MSSPKTIDDDPSPAYTPDIDFPKTGRLGREDLMDLANDLIRFLHTRTMKERFREQNGDRTRLAYARVELSAIQAYATLLKDEELEELKRRMELLEELKGEQRGGENK